MVRFIFASLTTSYTWFSVFAEADAPKVPMEAQQRRLQSISSPLPDCQKENCETGFKLPWQLVERSHLLM